MTSTSQLSTLQLKVRNFTPDDGEKIRSLANECQPLLVNGVYINIFLAKYFGNTCFVLEQGPDLIGFVSGLRSSIDPTVFFLWQLGIAQKSRGHGHSQPLIEAIVRSAQKLGCKSVQFSISPDNPQSLGAFSSFAAKNSLKLSILEEKKYQDPLSGKPGHEIFYELVV